MTVAVGIPTDIAVRLMIDTVAFAVTDSNLQQIKKSVPTEPKQYALIIKRREAPHF